MFLFAYWDFGANFAYRPMQVYPHAETKFKRTN